MTIPEEKRAGYISLKEASERFGYSQDYLGQLIRKGKIDGKLVYSHVAWVTTPEAVEKYISATKDKRKRRGADADRDHDDAMQSFEHSDFSLATDAGSATELPGMESINDDEQSQFGKWLIIFFRILVLISLLGALFVFYILTTAFGEEVRGGEFTSASTTFSLSANQNRHE